MSFLRTPGRWISVGRVIVVSTVLSGLAIGVATAELRGPSANDRQITLAVRYLMGTHHLSRRPLDDEISARSFKSYLKMWDPNKEFFLQSDIDEFMQFEKQLDDQIKNKDVRFAYTVFERFKTRVDERVKMIDELLAMPHDFTVEEEIVTDPDAVPWSRNNEEIREYWRKRVKYLLLAQKLDKVTGKEAIDKLSRRYHNFAKRIAQTDDSDLLEMYLSAITTSYDPHSTYMSGETLENFDIAMRLNLEGIGAALLAEDGYTTVSKIIPGGAADKDGRLKPKDRIVGVGEGVEGPMEDTTDMKLSDVVDRVRGAQGSTVRLQVIPAGKLESTIYAIKREKIALNDSAARSEVVTSEVNGVQYKIGIINLPSFYLDMEGEKNGVPDVKSTTADMRRLLGELRSQKVDAVIVDLRHNGGGSLPEAVNTTGLFIDRGPIVQTRDSDGAVRMHEDDESGVAWGGPLVVVIDKFSASASEIFAGAIQDYNRGIVVGDHNTHGKGTVQSLLNISNALFAAPNAPSLGALKVTMSKFYRPNGDSTQNRGVLSDVELPSLTSYLDVGESDLDYAMDFDKVKPANFRKASAVNDAMKGRLRELSLERRKSSEDFSKVERNIKRYQDQKGRKSLTLNEQKFMAERADLNAEKEQEKEIDEATDPNRPVFDSTSFYNKELLAITGDYIQLLSPPIGAANSVPAGVTR